VEGIDLRGKDYLTREEAAHYACVSVRHFDTIRRTRNIPVLDWAGKKVFRLPRMAPGSLSRAFDRALERAGLDGSLHCLRHTFCAHLVMAGVPLRTVQLLAGHAHFSTTEKYAHLAPGHLQDAVRGLVL